MTANSAMERTCLEIRAFARSTEKGEAQGLFRIGAYAVAAAADQSLFRVTFVLVNEVDRIEASATVIRVVVWIDARIAADDLARRAKAYAIGADSSAWTHVKACPTVSWVGREIVAARISATRDKALRASLALTIDALLCESASRTATATIAWIGAEIGARTGA